MTVHPHPKLVRQPEEQTPLLRASNRLESQLDQEQQYQSDNIGESEIEPTGRPPSSAPKTNQDPSLNRSVIPIISVLLIGVFVANADGSLVLATHSNIASEFHELSDSSWLVIGFGLASCAVQPLLGKFSDIYGRRTVLLFAYSIFTIGCAICGMGRSMPEVIVGRVLSGVGGAGMTSLVSIILTDLLPLRDLAAWRSYVNIVATTGRSLGGPVGGYLADTVGWRWSFLLQSPIIIAAIALCLLYLPQSHTESQQDSNSSKIARVDFLGSTLVVLAIVGFLLPLEIGGQKVPWSHPLVIFLLTTAIILSILFILVETKWAKEPVLPLRLFTYPVVALCCGITFLQISAQLSLMLSVPLYFQVTERSSATIAGAHLFPAVAGNAIAGLVAGFAIKRTGRYKFLIILATAIASTCYILLILRWNGNTNFWESLYIFPGGFGTGMAQSAVFIALTSSVDSSHTAIALSGLYFCSSFGGVSGMAASSAVLQLLTRRALYKNLAGIDNASEIIGKSLSNINYVADLRGDIRAKVVDAYLQGFTGNHYLSLFCSAVGLVLAILLREHRL